MNRIPFPLLTALAYAGFAQQAHAQDYPVKPVHVVVAYAPGGAVDLTARLLQRRLSEVLGQPLIIDNKPGAAGFVGAESVSRAPSDGYTLLYTVGADLAIRQLRPGAFDSTRDLTPVASAVASVTCVATRVGLPANTIGELIDYAKRNPGKLSYGTAGIGSTQHLAGERLKQHGAIMVHVPFKGVAPAMTALVAGEIDVSITNLATALPHRRQGTIRVLAVTQTRRFEGAPDIPALGEILPGFSLPVAWYGFFGPRGLPRPVVTKLAAAIARSLEAPEVKEKFSEAAMTVAFTGPEAFPAFIRDTADAYGKLIHAAGIELE